MAKPGKQTSLSSKKNVCLKICISGRDLKNRHNTFALCHKKTMPPGIEETKMAKSSLYTVGARMKKETILRIDKHIKETETRSELINKAVIHYLNSLENEQERSKTNREYILKDTELIEQLSELILKKLQNETFTITKK